MGTRVPMSLSLSHGTFFLLLGPFDQSDMRVYSKSYCMVLCKVELLSLGGPLFCERKRRRNRSGVKGEMGRGWKEGRKGRLQLRHIT